VKKVETAQELIPLAMKVINKFWGNLHLHIEKMKND